MERRSRVARETVQIDELLRILNEELAAYPECNDCRFVDIVAQSKAAEGECNWSTATLTCVGVDKDTCQLCSEQAEQVVAGAKARYNVE